MRFGTSLVFALASACGALLLAASCASVDDDNGDAAAADSGGHPHDSGGSTDGSNDAVADARPTGAAAPPCGTRAGMRGMTSRKITVGGLARTYLIYLPSSATPSKPLPLVFVFHGYTMSGQEMADITQYQALADREGIALAFPDGEAGPNSALTPWNVEQPGQTVCGDGQFGSATGDDFAFVDAMKADVAQDQCVDGAHVFATGFSMGGYFSHHIGCTRSDFRAVAPAAGGTLADLSACTTGHVPVIIFHGTADPLIADGCDDPTALPLLGFPASATLWAAKNGCKATYTTVATEGDAGGRSQCYLYDGCPADGQVELCTFTAMGHCWAGGASTGAGAAFGCPTFASATQLEWSFFKKYAW